MEITIPKLAQGEKYAGICLNEKGKPTHHLILLKGEKKLTWDMAMEWAKEIGGDLPTSQEQALLFANCKKHFKDACYWSNETYTTEYGWAWCQDFYDGYKNLINRSDELRARAVRRLPI